MILSAAGTTHQGKRDDNQDVFLCDPEHSIFLVCDGVGGVRGGREAANLASESASCYLRERLAELPAENGEDLSGSISTLIRESIQHACREVFRAASRSPAFGQMGSTLTMLYIHGSRAFVGHVGDSRLYLFRRGEIHLLTEDHTFLRELLNRGELTPEEVANNPYASVLTRWIGQGETLQVDLLQFDVLPDDKFLICSDGLESVYENEEELRGVVEGTDPGKSAEELVQRALARDGSDNITAIIVSAAARVPQDEAETNRVREVSLSIATLQRLYLFAGLSLQELIQVMERVVVVREPAGTVLIREDELSDSLMVILEGELRIERNGRHIRTLLEGNHVGEMALLTMRPRSATVTTATPATLLYFDRKSFTELLRREPGLGVKLLLNLSSELIDRLISANDLFASEHEQTRKPGDSV